MTPELSIGILIAFSLETHYGAIIRAAPLGSSLCPRKPDAIENHVTLAQRTEALAMPVTLVLPVRAKVLFALISVLTVTQMSHSGP
jgi:hypothetical protein